MKKEVFLCLCNLLGINDKFSISIVELMFINVELKLVVGISFQGFFLTLPTSCPLDFIAFKLGLVGIWYLLPSVCMLHFDALFE